MMRLRAAICLTFCLVMVGCAPKTAITNKPAGVTDTQVNNWTAAVNDLAQAQQLTHTSVELLIMLNRSGEFPDGQSYKSAMTYSGQAEQIEIRAAAFLKGAPNDWTKPTKAQILDYANQALAELQSAMHDGTLGVKSPESVKTFTDAIANAMAILRLIQGLAT